MDIAVKWYKCQSIRLRATVQLYAVDYWMVDAHIIPYIVYCYCLLLLLSLLYM